MDETQAPDPELLAAIAAAAPGHDRQASFPFDSLARLRAAGLLALTTPRRWGGGGAGLAEAARVVAAVGGACASTGLVLAMQLIQQALLPEDEGWPSALRERLGREAAEEGALVNALRTEPALGAPTRGGLPETVAERTPEGWRLTGRKIYCTGAPALRWMLVWARTAEAEPRCGYFLLPAGTPGTRFEPAWDHLGLRASASDDLVMEAAPIPAEYAGELRPPAAWAALPDTLLAWHALLPVAMYGGVAQAARDWTLGFLRRRVPTGLGAPLASLPRVQEAVGAIEEWRLANTRLLASAAAAVDAGRPPPGREVNLLKLTLAENAVRIVEQCATLAGNHALARKNPLERHWRDVLCARIHTPQADAARLAAGRAALEGG